MPTPTSSPWCSAVDIYVVRQGDTLFTISRSFGVSLGRLIADNGIADPARLVVGQALVIRKPERVYTVRAGDTLSSVSRQTGVSVRQLRRNNPALEGGSSIWPGQTLVLAYEDAPAGPLTVNAYAYPFIDMGLLQRTLPFLSYLTPFTYGITEQGGLVVPDDEPLIRAAHAAGTAALMHLSTLTQDGGFSNDLAHLVLTNGDVQDALVGNVLDTLSKKDYQGLDVDFEYVFPEDGPAYAAFIARLRRALAPLGLPVVVALAPKTSAQQRGLLYEAHNYAALGAAAGQVFLMTYVWYRFAHSSPIIDGNGPQCEVSLFVSLRENRNPPRPRRGGGDSGRAERTG